MPRSSGSPTAAGSRASTVVPRPGAESTRSEPPSSSTRSCIATEPTPAVRAGSMPVPPSRIRSTSSPSSTADRHLDVVGAGVPRDVVQRLGADPVAGDLDGGGQPRRVVVGEPGAQPERVGELAQRPGQPQLVEGGRSQPVGHPADGVQRLAGGVLQPGEPVGGGAGVGAHERPHGAQLHGQPGQGRARRRRAGPAAAAAAPPRGPGPARARPARSSSVSSTAWTATPPCRPMSVSSRSSSACRRRPAPGATVSVPTGVAPETRSACASAPPPGRVPHSPVCPPALAQAQGTRSDAATEAASPSRTASAVGARCVRSASRCSARYGSRRSP